MTDRVPLLLPFPIGTPTKHKDPRRAFYRACSEVRRSSGRGVSLATPASALFGGSETSLSAVLGAASGFGVAAGAWATVQPA